MATRTWLKATRTKTQSRTGGFLWSVFAVGVWTLFLTTDGAGWWQCAMAACWSLLAVHYLVSWRLWKPEWDRPR